MEDGGRNDKRGRPQQQLYKPGSGPLRKTSPSSEITMDSCRMDSSFIPPPAPRGRGHNRFRNKMTCNDNNDFGRGSLRMVNENAVDSRRRGRKPERPLYSVRPGGVGPESAHPYGASDVPDSSHSAFANDESRKDGHYSSHSNLANDHNYNRNYRQVSEPRSTSPNFQGDVNSYRNRDTRSMETSVGRHNQSSHVGKPPSGRRNSAGYPADGVKPNKFMQNLDNVPPRFRKKFLAQSGQHSLDSSTDSTYRDRNISPHTIQPAPVNVWSQTLPSRGRGRMKDIDFDKDKFMAPYLKFYDTDGSKQSTPTGSRQNLYESSNFDQFENRNKDKVYPTTSGSNLQETKENQSKNRRQKNVDNSHSIEQSRQKQASKNNHKNEEDDTMTSLTNTFSNLTSLDWTEEVEKSIKLNDLDSPSLVMSTSASFLPAGTSQESKKSETSEPRKSNRARRREKRLRSGSKKRSTAHRSTSRGNRREKSIEEPIVVPAVAKPDPHHRDSGSESVGGTGRQRERRDSHRSNRSSNVGSRDDLDRWRSWRSFSREHSPERRIVSQCNSRDPSSNRAASPRDLDGFRVPQSHPSNGRSSRNQRRNSSSSTAWSGTRVASSERPGRVSPAPSGVGGGGGSGGGGGAGGGSGGGGAGGRGGGGGGEGRRRRGHRNGRDRKEAEARNRTPQRNKSPAHVAAPSGTLSWREEILESKKTSHKDRPQETSKKSSGASQPAEKASAKESPIINSHPGILLLPQSPPSHIANDTSSRATHGQTKTLFDPQNPSKPIVVQTSSSGGVDSRTERLNWAAASAPGGAGDGARPAYYDESSDAHRTAKNRALLVDIECADTHLQQYCVQGALAILDNWQHISETRRFLQNALQRLLISDLKFCSTENVEHQFWRILYYKFIEALRKHLTLECARRDEVLATINNIIEEGNKYFESLVELLEKAYKFKVEDYINGQHLILPKGLGFVGLGLHSVQKMYLFLGDLARYKEQVNDSTNYGKSKFWYTKAQQINPKNGRPYNQLAILAIYSRRKLDAVYYYMRSLMSSNPFHSARESLISLFDENRKKYESAERKRRAAREAARAAAAAAEGGRGTGPGGAGGGARGLRREVWVRPGGGRTTTLRRDDTHHDDELANMTCVELNKNFITSYLHVHGKLITKIGMESLHESASQMLRQFRALLRQQPLPTTANRLLQLAALNMFAIETCIATPKEGGGGAGGARCARAECALGVALLMFGLLVERCCALLPEPPGAQAHADALLLLPAIKVWCDWMLCHSSIWNPPPSLESFNLGADSDPWEWFAKLMNILEEQDDKSIVFETEPREGVEPIRLSEDATTAGFTPLMYMEVEPAYAAPDSAGGANPEHVLRTRRLLFFGTEYLVGVEPPALRLHCPAGEPARYVSAVRPPPPPPEDEPLQDVSEDEEAEESSSAAGEGGAAGAGAGAGAGAADTSDETTRRLLRRKEMLEARRANMEQRRKRMQEILRGGWVSVELEVRPRWLVPDTNCFIDHLPLLQRAALAPHHPYILAVPLVVVTELEGLSRCARVGGAARAALVWLSETSASAPSVRFATTRGSLLASAAFTAESAEQHASNDDRVLATALSLHRNLTHQSEEVKVSEAAGAGGGAEGGGAAPLVREVVLLTDDRNLRVKALAAELPARALPAFVQWAALLPAPAPPPHK